MSGRRLGGESGAGGAAAGKRLWPGARHCGSTGILKRCCGVQVEQPWWKRESGRKESTCSSAASHVSRRVERQLGMTERHFATPAML